MQTKPTTGLRTAATDYVTVVQQACNKITGFSLLYKELERSISISGKSIGVPPACSINALSFFA